jgi:neurotransmitter:Na+ symporter, NSS family
VQIICFSWIFGIDRGWQEAHEGAHIRIPRVYKFVMKYVAPLYLVLVFAAFTIQNLPTWVRGVANQPLAQGALILVAGTTIVLLVCVRVGEQRWRAAGLDLDGRKPVE